MSNLGRQVLFCLLYFVIDRTVIVNFSVRIISKLLSSLWVPVTVSYQSSCLFVVFLTARKADTGWSSDKKYKVKKLQTGGDPPRGCNSHVSFGYFPLFSLSELTKSYMHVYARISSFYASP